MRPFFAVARKKYDRVPENAAKTHFEIPNLEDIAPQAFSSDAA